MSEKELECSACGQTTTKDGLELTPSGKQFKRHNDGKEVCKGGKPQTPDPEPVKIVKAGTKPNTRECVECGLEMPALKTPGKVRKHTNPQTLQECEQRPSVEATCPACEREIGLAKMRFKNHKDLAKNVRCPGSGKTPAEAEAAKQPEPKPKKAAAKKADNGYKTLSPLDKSKFKAKRLGDELKQYADPWRYTIETGPDADQATLVLRRGTGGDVEEMRISWWAGACLGGDGKITHEYKGRKIAVRNANAIRLRGAMTHEEIKAEAAKVATRKVGPKGPRKSKTPEELQALMPFDPTTAEDDEILKAVLNRTVKWTRTTDGQMESDVVKKLPKQPISRTKTGIRNLTFTGQNTTRTVRVANLVSVG